MARLLWIEDHIDGFRSLVEKLKNKGIELIFAASQEEVNKYKLEDFDFFIIDNKIGKNSRFGLNFLKKMGALSGKRTILHTAYMPPILSNGEIIHNESNKSFVGYVKKDLPEIDKINDFWDDVAEKFYAFFCNSDPMDTLAESFKAHNEFETISNLSLSEMETEHKRVKSENKTELENAFNDGAIFVIVSTDPKVAIESYNLRKEIPSNNTIIARFSKMGLFPFVFRKDLSFDDTNCHGRHRAERIQDYPRAVLTFGQDDIAFHFDTGADTSIFGEAFVNEVGNAKIVGLLPFGITIQTKEHLAKEIELASVIKNPKAATKRAGVGYPVEIPGIMITNWEGCDLQVPCSSVCSRTSKKIENCIYRRNGLIGRDLYLHNSLHVTLNPSDPQIAIDEDE